MTNVIVNGNFDDGLNGWTTDATWSATLGIGGSPCAVLGNNQELFQVIPTVIGQEYTATFFLQFTNTGGGGDAVVFRLRSDPFVPPNYINVSILPNNIGSYVQYQYTFTPLTTSTLFYISDNDAALTYYVDDVSVVPTAVCYRGTSKVLSKNKIGYIEERNASDITTDHLVYDIMNEKFVPVVANSVTGPVSRFKMIPKGAINSDENIPSEDLYLTPGHTIVYQGKEVKARHLPFAVTKKLAPEAVYSIYCQERTIILINGTPVLADAR
jgi:hypothetical protein